MPVVLMSQDVIAGLVCAATELVLNASAKMMVMVLFIAVFFA
jgi:hypothetical protein